MFLFLVSNNGHGWNVFITIGAWIKEQQLLDDKVYNFLKDSSIAFKFFLHGNPIQIEMHTAKDAHDFIVLFEENPPILFESIYRLRGNIKVTIWKIDM